VVDDEINGIAKKTNGINLFMSHARLVSPWHLIGFSHNAV
jgi:hypothetical protein